MFSWGLKKKVAQSAGGPLESRMESRDTLMAQTRDLQPSGSRPSPGPFKMNLGIPSQMETKWLKEKLVGAWVEKKTNKHDECDGSSEVTAHLCELSISGAS